MTETLPGTTHPLTARTVITFPDRETMVRCLGSGDDTLRQVETAFPGLTTSPRGLELGHARNGVLHTQPRFARLLRAFEAGGAAIAQWRDALRAPTLPGRYEAADAGAQWRAAAAWAAQQLRAHPSGRYAIVSPQLESESPFARRVLSQALGDGPEGPALPFNVAVGRPLDEWPLTRAALAWLRALARVGAVDGDLAGQEAKVTQDWEVDMAALAARSGWSAPWSATQRATSAQKSSCGSTPSVCRIAARWRSTPSKQFTPST